MIFYIQWALNWEYGKEVRILQSRLLAYEIILVISIYEFETDKLLRLER